MRQFLIHVYGVLLLLSLASSSMPACTGICLMAEDGSVVPARTMEFGVDLESDIIVVPRGYAYMGETTTTHSGPPRRIRGT